MSGCAIHDWFAAIGVAICLGGCSKQASPPLSQQEANVIVRCCGLTSLNGAHWVGAVVFCDSSSSASVWCRIRLAKSAHVNIEVTNWSTSKRSTVSETDYADLLLIDSKLGWVKSEYADWWDVLPLRDDDLAFYDGPGLYGGYAILRREKGERNLYIQMPVDKASRGELLRIMRKGPPMYRKRFPSPGFNHMRTME